MTATRSYIPAGSFMNHVVNPIVARFGLTTTLEVRGRKTGHLISVPMGPPLELEGQRYLVSGRGETHWVRNLRAAGQATLRRHGRSEPFRAVEVEGLEHERVVAAYRAKLGHSVDRYFAEIPDPADHPAFRIEPIREDATH